jgi:hypothetical protein
VPTQCRRADFVGYVRGLRPVRQFRVAIAGARPQNARGLKHRWLVVALALAAASAFALSTQDGRWWSIGDVAIGPFGARSPFGGGGDLSWAGGGARWSRFGVATGAGGLIAMLVLIVLAAGVAARRVPRLAAKTSLAAIVTAGLAGIGFVAARPDNNLPFALDRGVALFAIAIGAGIVAAIVVLRAPRPAARADAAPDAGSR